MKVVRNFVLASLVGLCGCATQSPAYWSPAPLSFQAKVVKVYKTDNLELWCGNRATNKWFACTSRDFSTGECVIYVRRVFFSPSLVQHEKCHCANLDHDDYPGVNSPACPVNVDAIPHTVADL